MRSGSSRKIGLILLYTFIVLVVLGIAAFILRFTNGGTDDFKFFYVADENNNVFATTDNLYVQSIADTRLNVNYLFEGDKGFEVKITPNITDDTAFDYFVDGQTKSYSEDLNLNKAFNVQIYDNYFTFRMPTSMQETLNAIYAGQTVYIAEDIAIDIDISDKPYFDLTINSYNGKDKTVLKLYFIAYVEDIEIPDVAV